MKILIAEDDILSVIYFKSVLADYGSCVTTIEGFQAIEEFSRARESDLPYDLVCLDIMLPKMDGLQVLGEIRNLENKKRAEKHKKTKIIMLSALSDEMTINFAKDVGCDAYIRKPVSIERIEEALHELGFYPRDSYSWVENIPC